MGCARADHRNVTSALRQAASDLVDILFAGQEWQRELGISVVPYTAMGNIGRKGEDWLQPGSPDSADDLPQSLAGLRRGARQPWQSAWRRQG